MTAKFHLKPLSIACTTASLLIAVPAHAVKFNWGDIEGTFTSNFSVGASWRMEDADNDHLSPGNTNGEGRASVSTTDDGNLNYDKNDAFSTLFKGVHDLDLNAGRFGVFTRVKYWYDYIQAEEDVDHGHVANDYIADSELEMGDFEDLAQESGFEFLDYYVYGDFTLGDMPLDLRAGNMVVSWGESTFIQNSVNVINPFDVTALRRPGSEIKEALLPTGLVYGNLGVTGDLSVEAFYQYTWDRTVLDECGTYWSAADIYGGGCDKLTVSTADPDFDQINREPVPFFIPRGPDDEASDSGQWGIAARYFVESLNSTEFGAYYVNYHSRTPILSGINATENFGSAFLFGSNPQYFFEFPEDIEVYALTFATNVGDWAVSGELSYRPEFPLQINTVDISQALALGDLAEWSRVNDRRRDAGAGGILHGYDEVKYTQAQMTFVKFFEQVLGAQRLSFAAEVGGAWLDDMDDNLNYGRHGTFGIGSFTPFQSEGVSPFVPAGTPISCNSHPALAPLGVLPNTQERNCTNDGFTDDFSFGYRLRASLDYSDVFWGVNLTPNMAWSHDPKGNGPAPTFVEDRMAFSVGVTADYLNTYKADLGYTTFFGADYNELQDRDFLSLSFSVAF
jgi:hypothetical protein